MSSWTLTVAKDPENDDNMILEFPDDLLQAAGWKAGDTLEWVDNKDGSWILRKTHDNDSVK